MSRSDPLVGLSRKTATAIDNTPEVEAFLSGSRVVPNTWGGYATRAVDLGLVEPVVSEVVDLLGGPNIVNLRDPDIIFDGGHGYSWYKSDYINRQAERHLADLRPESRRLVSTANLIMSQWEVDPEIARSESDAIQEMIDGGQIDDDTATSLACAKRDGLWSGVEVTMADFMQQMLGANVLDEEVPSELANYWAQGLSQVVNEFEDDYGYIDDFDRLPISEIHLARNHTGAFLACLQRAPERLADVYAQKDWEYIEPIFAAPTSLSVIDGTEK